MKHKPAKVYQDGIRLFGMRYWHEALIPLLGRTIEIRYDPANIGALVCFSDRNFVCEARQDQAFSMQLTEQERHELTKRRKAARKILTDYRETQTIALDQEQALDLVVNDIRRSKVYVLKANPTLGADTGAGAHRADYSRDRACASPVPLGARRTPCARRDHDRPARRVQTRTRPRRHHGPLLNG